MSSESLGGIEGSGTSSRVHTSRPLSLSADLPVAIHRYRSTDP